MPELWTLGGIPYHVGLRSNFSWCYYQFHRLHQVLGCRKESKHSMVYWMYIHFSMAILSIRPLLKSMETFFRLAFWYYCGTDWDGD